MYIYKVRQNGFWKDYSNEYDNEKDARQWFSEFGDFVTRRSDRNIVLFNNSKKVI